MNAIRPARDRNVCPRIDEQPSLTRILADCINNSASQVFQLSGAEIFLPQLDQVDVATSRLGDFGDQGLTAFIFAANKL